MFEGSHHAADQRHHGAITGTVVAVVTVVGRTATATEYVRERDFNARMAGAESTVIAIESELRIVKAGVDMDRNTDPPEAIKGHVSESRDAPAEGDTSRE